MSHIPPPQHQIHQQQQQQQQQPPPQPQVKPRSSANAIPTVSYSPTDITIPPTLYDKIPNLKEYKRLKEAERKIDLLIARKALDFQAIQQKTIHPFEYKTNTGVLRVFIFNTCENQPWQQQEQSTDPEKQPTWTLRIEGRYIKDKNTEPDENAEFKFSSFLSGIAVDLLPNENYPNIQENNQNIIEWRDDGSQNVNRHPNNVGFDGMDIKRPGIFNLKVKIAIMIKSYTAKLRVTDDLARFMGKFECTQQEVMYTIWQYALSHKLFKNTSKYMHVPAVETTSINPEQDQDSHDDLTLTQCDEILYDLLKVSEFRFSDLYRLIQPHFKPREPIILDYEIDTRKSTTLGDIILDVPVELPVNLSRAQQELLDLNKTAFENLSHHDTIIEKLNQKISLAIIALRNANSRENFYSELAKNPVEFIKKWVETQSETLKALKSDEGYEEEIVRRAKYFEDNEDMIKEKIDLLFGVNKF
ncbi:SNF12 [Candida pseudojiufengensis]|uniref:SNF12 n=1 Tax=Candida pseudojiufengensis TaxID=497109 RepID=UPI0022259572|nr:SNF12 [Candida pseudojiufengensis]KAI5965299.1 SNF12 [Candida pseudojiufengensis]